MQNCTPELALQLIQFAQWSLYLFNALLAGFSLAAGISQRNDDSEEKVCHCELHVQRPQSTCELSVESHDRSLFDPLFLAICFWILALSVLLLARELFLGARSRLFSSLVLAIVGSFELAIGHDFDKWDFTLGGLLSSCFAVFLFLSIALCRRPAALPKPHEQSLLQDEETTHDDEFGRGFTAAE
jgi:hypothetical protein